MPHKSKYPDLDIPASNILDFIFPPNDPIPPRDSIWHDSVNPSNSLSKSQGLHRIKQLAIALDNLGIKEQEVVMIFTPNNICVPIAYMGIVGSKRIFSGANPIYTVNEIVYQIENTNAKALLVHPSLLDTAIAAARKTNLPLNRLFQFNDSLSPASQGVQDWFSILGSDDAANSYQWPKLNPDEAKTTIATINYSSGTTGLPKGVMISHRNLIANVMQTVYMRDQEMPYNPEGVYRPAGMPQERWSESVWILRTSEPEQEQGVLPYFAYPFPYRKHTIALVPESVTCFTDFLATFATMTQTLTILLPRTDAFLPLYHAYGQLFTCLIAPLLGVKVYVMRKFEYPAFLEVRPFLRPRPTSNIESNPPQLTQVIQRFRITHLQVAPPIVVMLARRPETKSYDLTSLKYIMCGAAPLSRELQNEVSQRFGLRLTQGWG